MGKVYILSIFWIFNTLAVATPTTREQLCTYDPDGCQTVFDAQGNARTPEPEILAYLSHVNDEIQSVARLYNISPLAIAGAIASENTMNVGVDEEITAFLAQANLEEINVLMDWSYGVGQVNPSTSIKVEELAAQIERRPVRSSDEIAAAMRSGVNSLNYVAATLRYYQDFYGDRGINIEGNVPALITLYNIGATEEQVEATRARGGEPRPNFMGVFFEHNQQALQDAIGWDPTRGSYPPQNLVYQDDGFLPRRATRPLSIYPSPPHCDVGQRGRQGEIARAVGRRNYPVQSQRRGTFRIIGRAPDCELRGWSLVEFTDGEVGWIDNATLETQSDAISADISGNISRDNFTPLSFEHPRCRRQAQRCLQEIATTGLRVSQTPPYRFAPITFDGENPANMRTFDRNCFNENMWYNTQAHSPYRWGDANTDETRQLTRPRAAQAYRQLRDTERRLKAALGDRYEGSSAQRALDGLLTQLQDNRSRSEIINMNITNFNTAIEAFSDNQITMQELVATSASPIFSTSQGSPFRFNGGTYNALTIRNMRSEFESSCRDFITPSRLQALSSYMQDSQNYREDRRGFAEIEANYLNYCRAHEFVRGQRDASTFCDPDCAFGLATSGGNMQEIRMTPAMIREHLTSREVIQNQLDANFDAYSATAQWANGAYRNTANEGNRLCNFDEVGTLEAIRNLAGLNCIEQIFLPHGETFRNYYNQGGNVADKLVFSLANDDTVLLKFRNCPLVGETSSAAGTGEVPEEESSATER